MTQAASVYVPVPQQDVPVAYDTVVEREEGGLNRLTLLVDGIHCAGCIGKIESALQKEKDIKKARLNFSTRRLVIEWHGSPERASALAALVANLGYRVMPFDTASEKKSALDEEKFLLLCLGVSGFAMGNIMLLSVGLWTTTAETMGIAVREFMHIVSGLIAIPACLFAGRPYFRSAVAALSHGRTNMDVPISVGVILTLIMSVFATIKAQEHAYFDSAVMLLFFLLIGRYLDARTRRSARSAAGNLLAALSGTALVVAEDGGMTRLPISHLREGMIVQVAAGEKIAGDGAIISGETEIDTSIITGETLPRVAKAGDAVYGGTTNLIASIRIKITKQSSDSLLAGIVRLMEQATQSHAKYVRIADRAAKLYTPVVHLLALLTLIGWLAFGTLPWPEAVMVAVTVLIITCPCALGLAVPVVQVLAVGQLMKRGILVKAGDALERLSSIDTIICDKTGTLTLGRPELLDAEKIAADDLALAATIAAHSTHPLAKALAQYDREAINTLIVKEHAGKGLKTVIDGKKITLGSRAWAGDQNAPLVEDRLELWLNVEGKAPVPFYFSDQLRPDAKDVIAALKRKGIKILLLSGDRSAAAKFTARELGIDDARGDLTPPEKFAIMEDLKRQGHRVLMVGDGLNDAPALAGADIAISPSSAADVTQNAADIVFMGESLSPLLKAYETASFSQKLVEQNFLLAILYNVIAVPLAMAGFVTPTIAAAAMAGSSLVVVGNSFRLRRVK